MYEHDHAPGIGPTGLVVRGAVREGDEVPRHAVACRSVESGRLGIYPRPVAGGSGENEYEGDDGKAKEAGHADCTDGRDWRRVTCGAFAHRAVDHPRGAEHTVRRLGRQNVEGGRGTGGLVVTRRQCQIRCTYQPKAATVIEPGSSQSCHAASNVFTARPSTPAPGTAPPYRATSLTRS